MTRFKVILGFPLATTVVAVALTGARAAENDHSTLLISNDPMLILAIDMMCF
jgi:hypothetical protein